MQIKKNKPYVWRPVCAVAHMSQKRAPYPLYVELQAVVSGPLWVLGAAWGFPSGELRMLKQPRIYFDWHTGSICLIIFLILLDHLQLSIIQSYQLLWRYRAPTDLSLFGLNDQDSPLRQRGAVSSSLTPALHSTTFCRHRSWADVPIKGSLPVFSQLLSFEALSLLFVRYIMSVICHGLLRLLKAYLRRFSVVSAKSPCLGDRLAS